MRQNREKRSSAGWKTCSGTVLAQLFPEKIKKKRKKAFFPLAKGGLFLYKSLRRAEVAQLVEQGTENPRVGSSILSLGTIFF